MRWEAVRALVDRPGWSLSRACRRLGIGRMTAYRWRECAKESRAKLESCSSSG